LTLLRQQIIDIRLAVSSATIVLKERFAFEFPGLTVYLRCFVFVPEHHTSRSSCASAYKQHNWQTLRLACCTNHNWPDSPSANIANGSLTDGTSGWNWS